MDPQQEGSVFSIGDCSFIEDAPLPCTAQVAEREGRYLGKLLSYPDVRDREPFSFKSMGKLCFISCGRFILFSISLIFSNFRLIF